MYQKNRRSIPLMGPQGPEFAGPYLFGSLRTSKIPVLLISSVLLIIKTPKLYFYRKLSNMPT